MTIYFLVECSLESPAPPLVREFESVDEAMENFERRERALRGKTGTQVVLLGSSSQEAARATHGNLWWDDGLGALLEAETARLNENGP